MALFAPSVEALTAVSETCKHLEKLVEANKDSHDGLSVFGDEILRAARSLSSLEWGVIRDERFHVTPEGLFDEIVKNVEAIARKSHGEAKRRKEWLAERVEEEEGAEGEDDDAEEQAVRVRIDEFGLDLDRFVPLGGRRLVGWKQAVKIAGWVQVDEMRAQQSPGPGFTHICRTYDKRTGIITTAGYAFGAALRPAASRKVLGLGQEWQ